MLILNELKVKLSTENNEIKREIKEMFGEK